MLTTPVAHTRSRANAHDLRAIERIALLRTSIDRIDEMLISLIGERQRLARAVGATKRAAGLPSIDPAREAAVTGRIVQHAEDHGVSATEMAALAQQLIRLARGAQGVREEQAREAA
jgi:chorismate mutase